MEALKKIIENWNNDLIPCYEDIAEEIYDDFGERLLSYDFNLPFGQIKRIIYEVMNGEVETVRIQYIDRFKGEKECEEVDDEDIYKFYIDKANEYISSYLEKMQPIWDKENDEMKHILETL
jgi:hypothetical protein